MCSGGGKKKKKRAQDYYSFSLNPFARLLVLALLQELLNTSQSSEIRRWGGTVQCDQTPELLNNLKPCWAGALGAMLPSWVGAVHRRWGWSFYWGHVATFCCWMRKNVKNKIKKWMISIYNLYLQPQGGTIACVLRRPSCRGGAGLLPLSLGAVPLNDCRCCLTTFKTLPC